MVRAMPALDTPLNERNDEVREMKNKTAEVIPVLRSRDSDTSFFLLCVYFSLSYTKRTLHHKFCTITFASLLHFMNHKICCREMDLPKAILNR